MNRLTLKMQNNAHTNKMQKGGFTIVQCKRRKNKSQVNSNLSRQIVDLAFVDDFDTNKLLFKLKNLQYAILLLHIHYNAF